MPCRYSYAKLITTIITTFSTCMLLFYIIKRLEDGSDTESALKIQSTLLKIRTFISVIIGLPLLVYIILDQSCREYSYDLWLSSIISYIFDILSIAMHAAIINNL